MKALLIAIFCVINSLACANSTASMGVAQVSYTVINQTSSSLVISYITEDSNCFWLPGQEPQQGQVIRQGQNVKLSCYTNSINVTPSFYVVLAGYGRPIVISARGHAAGGEFGAAAMNVKGNSIIQAKTTSLNTGMPTHVMGVITLSNK